MLFIVAQLQNVSLSSESYTINVITSLDSPQKLSHPISNEGYEIPVKIINNEYLELCSDNEYLDLSGTSPTIETVDTRDSEPESLPEDINLLYCNMNPEQL